MFFLKSEKNIKYVFWNTAQGRPGCRGVGTGDQRVPEIYLDKHGMAIIIRQEPAL